MKFYQVFFRSCFCYSQRELLLPKIFITKNTQIILKNNLYSYRAFLSQLLRPTIFIKKAIPNFLPFSSYLLKPNMTLLTYIHALAELLTLLEESFGCKELLPQTRHKQIFPSICLKKIFIYGCKRKLPHFIFYI